MFSAGQSGHKHVSFLHLGATRHFTRVIYTASLGYISLTGRIPLIPAEFLEGSGQKALGVVLASGAVGRAGDADGEGRSREEGRQTPKTESPLQNVEYSILKQGNRMSSNVKTISRKSLDIFDCVKHANSAG